MTALSDAVFSKSGIKVLKLFIDDPRLEIHQSEVIRMSGLSSNTSIKLLKVFAVQGIFEKEKKGDLLFYHLSKDNPVVKQLKIFLNIEALHSVFRQLKDDDIDIYLFGSAARGEDNDKSDIDLLVITDTGKDKVLKALNDAWAVTGKEVNPIFYTHKEYTNLPINEKSFYKSMDKEKIRVI